MLSPSCSSNCFATYLTPDAPTNTNNQHTIAQAGMMSYPNFNGAEKTLQYVDFRLLAEEAERAGVDVRFVFLTRSARSILVSDTEHNNYGGS